MRPLLLLLLLIPSLCIQSQTLKDKLKEAKNKAKQKLEQKSDYYIDNGVEKGIETIDSVVTGKKKITSKEKKKRKTAVNELDNPAETINPKELVFQTSIRTSDQKEKTEEKLKEMTEIRTVKIDADTGIAFITIGPNENIVEKIESLFKKMGYKARLLQTINN